MTKARKRENSDFPSAVKAIRVRLGQTLRQFADALGVNVGTVSRYESGQRKPGLLLLYKILKIANGVERNPIIRELEDVFVVDNLTAEEAIRMVEREAPAALIDDDRLPPSNRPNLDRFSYFAGAISAEQFEVDSALADLLQAWYDSDVNDPSVRQAFADAATFLRVKLATIDSGASLIHSPPQNIPARSKRSA